MHHLYCFDVFKILFNWSVVEKDSLESKRWWIAAAGVLMQLFLGTVYAWSIFKNPMMATHGWSETQTQGAFMIYAAVFALSVAFGGNLVDRKGPKFVGTLGGALFGTGLLLAGVANAYANIGLLYLAYGIIAGMGGGFGYVTPLATLIRWFPDKRGLVTGLAVMGYGFGAFIMGNVGPALIIELGIASTFIIWGAFSLIFVLGAVGFLKNPPVNWEPAIVSHISGNTISPSVSFTFEQAVRTPQFWILWAMLLLIISAGLGFISQLSPMAQNIMEAAVRGNISEEQMKVIVIASGSIVAFAGVFNGVGRLFWAWTSDAMGRKAIFTILLLTQAVGYVVLAHSSGAIMFAVVSCYLLSCYGGSLSSMPAFVADEFGPEHIGKIYGIIFTSSALAGIIGPYLFAYIKEITGSFSIALYIVSGSLVVGAFLAMTFKKPQKKS
jgi:OFA family oxalate/formate antiporter-like MFS transporter